MLDLGHKKKKSKLGKFTSLPKRLVNQVEDSHFWPSFHATGCPLGFAQARSRQEPPGTMFWRSSRKARGVPFSRRYGSAFLGKRQLDLQFRVSGNEEISLQGTESCPRAPLASRTSTGHSWSPTFTISKTMITNDEPRLQFFCWLGLQHCLSSSFHSTQCNDFTENLRHYGIAVGPT